MMPSDLELIAEFIDSRWGSLPKAWNNHKAMHAEFKRFTTGAVMEALNELFREGELYSPKPPTVYKRAKVVQARRFEDGTDQRPSMECQGNHVWAVVHYPGAVWVKDDERVLVDDCDEGTEHHQCALCHEERFLRRSAA